MRSPASLKQTQPNRPMTSAISAPLHEQQYSLQHDRWIELLSHTDNLLLIQDLDGVCMGLVNDPLHRNITTDYVEATQSFDGSFYVLTNGEHVGQRGVNGIIDRAYGRPQSGQYLPGLAAGGVQWQDRDGIVSHPGVSEAELRFLKRVPDRIRTALWDFAQSHDLDIDASTLAACINASALDNIASPTANLNTFHRILGHDRDRYVALQKAMQALMDALLTEAAAQGLDHAFFVHYAPNHGRGADGKELIWLSQQAESGTTDFQFMVRGAIKEAGVLALLNRYYAQRTGQFPLGEAFNVRQAPHDHQDLLDLVKKNFDPAQMPTVVGVGDTVTSVVTEAGAVKRGGSDRNFLHLVQDIGRHFGTGNVVTYVDSSGGELKNRKAIQLTDAGDRVLEGPGDPQDHDDPLTLNVVFPGGHRQYCAAFQAAAQQRSQR